MPRIHWSPEDPDLDVIGATPDDAVVADAFAAWRAQVEAADAWLDAGPDLDARVVGAHGEDLSIREVLIHMVEEYARHCGHADLLRERIDGRTGA